MLKKQTNKQKPYINQGEKSKFILMRELESVKCLDPIELWKSWIKAIKKQKKRSY